MTWQPETIVERVAYELLLNRTYEAPTREEVKELIEQIERSR